MKAFNVMRYLRQFSLLILLVMLVGAFGVYSFGTSRQTYTASAVLQYTNDGASSGYTPNGENLDVEEIYCSEVIARAIETLGLGDMPDSLRSRCYVKPVISEDQQTINQVLLDKGEDPNFFADTYTVYFVANSSRSAEYARDVLDAIISNYCQYYSEKYIEQSLLPNSIANLANKDYDYIETVEVLESATAEMLGYLEQKKSSYPDFRASSTGYAYADLFDMYEYFYNYEIPSLYAMILSQAQSRDVDVLVKRLTSELESYQLRIKNKQEQIAYLNSLITNFTQRNKDMMDYHYHDQSASSQSEYILKDVENRQTESDQETTYDSLLQEYVDLKIDCEFDRIALEHDQYLLDVFNRLNAGNAAGDEAIQQAFSRYSENMNRCYDIVDRTSREFNSALSANFLQMLGTVKVSQSVNVKLYTLLAIVLFAVLGCGGALVLGRGADFVEYLLYVDRRVSLPNRARCDMFIEEESRQLLPDDYSCLYIVLDSLRLHSGRHGRELGDEVLKDFAAILKGLAQLYGFVGYNGAGQFMAFFADCSAEKARAIESVLAQKVAEYNGVYPERKMEYSCGVSNSTGDGCYEIRELLRLAVQRIHGKDGAR